MTNEQSIQNFKYGDMQFDLNKYSKDLNKNEVDSKFNSVFEMLDNNKDGWIVKDELQKEMGYMANEKGLLIFGNGKDNIILQFLNKYFPELVSKINDRQEIEQNEKELANELKKKHYIDIANQILHEKFNNIEEQGDFALVYDDKGRYLGKYAGVEMYIADDSVNDSGAIVSAQTLEIICYYKREKQEGKPDIETRYYENEGFATVTQGNESIEYDLERNNNSDFILGKIRSKYTTEYDEDGNISKQTIKNIADGTTTVLDGNTCGTKYDSEGNVLYTILTAESMDYGKVQIHLYPDGHIEGISSDESNECLGVMLRNKEIVEIIHPDDNISEPNGEIDSGFKQNSTGDCWLLASIKAIANSPKGLKILNDSLNVLPNGDVEVTLQGVNRTYTVTKFELNTNRELAHGDGDIRALEIAINKYFKEEGMINFRTSIDNGNIMSLAYNILVKNSGHVQNALLDSFRHPGTLYYIFTDDYIDSFNTKDKIITVSGINIFADDIHVNSAKKNNAAVLVNSHAYAVLRSDKDYVYLVNPWDSENELKVPRKTFKEFFIQVTEMQL